jgi:hypothetical protein
MKNFALNFIVHSPTPTYVNYIGGSMVCHSLANDLASLGENSYILSDSTNSNYVNGVIPWGSQIDCDKENTIVIYSAGADHVFHPDSYKNISSIPNSVRWLLGDQQYTYNESDKFYKYCDHFIAYPSQKVDGQFLSYDVDFDIFKNHRVPRKGTCFFSKGHTISTQYHPKDSIDLSQMYNMLPEDRMRFLSDVFNTVETFYLYTHRSFIAMLAALCGCNVVVFPYTWEGVEIPLSQFDKESWKKSLPTFKYGVSCGVDDIEWSAQTNHLLKQHIVETKNTGLKNIKQFVDNCYEWMDTKYNLNLM